VAQQRLGGLVELAGADQLRDPGMLGARGLELGGAALPAAGIRPQPAAGPLQQRRQLAVGIPADQHFVPAPVQVGALARAQVGQRQPLVDAVEPGREAASPRPAQAQRQPLEAADHRVQVARQRRRQPRHPESPPRHRLHQSVGSQAGQRLAQRGAADAQRLADALLLEPLAGREAAVREPAQQLLADLVAQVKTLYGHKKSP
jgi:hypothetical protein